MQSLSLIVLVVQLISNGEASQKRYDRYQVIRVHDIVPNVASFFKALCQNSQGQVEMWHFHNRSMDIMVAPHMQPLIRAYLLANSMDYDLLIDDVQRLIDVESQVNTQSVKRTHRLSTRGSSFVHYFNLEAYHSYTEIVTYLQQLKLQYPAMVDVFDIGQTWNGTNITAIMVGSDVLRKLVYRRSVNIEQRPMVWIDAGVHAREWIAPAVALHIINDLLTKYTMDATIQSYVNSMDFVIVPVANPEGYEHSRRYDRLWRKNRNPNGAQYLDICKGVDLNRNFDWHFSESDSSPDKCEHNYKGDHAFSEPESQAIRDFILSNKKRIKMYVTLHSYAQLWMYPYSYRNYTTPADWQDLQTVARRAAERVQAFYGTVYDVGIASNVLYEASGASADWVKGAAGVKFAYVIELPPDRHNETANTPPAFLLPPSRILPICIETWAGIKVVVDEVMQRYVWFTKQ